MENIMQTQKVINSVIYMHLQTKVTRNMRITMHESCIYTSLYIHYPCSIRISCSSSFSAILRAYS